MGEGATGDRPGFMAETRRVFREHPTLRMLVLVSLLSSLTQALLVPVLPLFLLDRGLTFFQLGSLFSLVAAASIGVQLLAGRRQGFFGRRDVIVGLLLGSVLTFPLYLFVHSPLGFLLVSAANALTAAAAGPGLMVLIANLAPAGLRAGVYSVLGMWGGLAYAAGLIVGGALLGVGYVAVFLAGGLLALMSLGAMLPLLVAGNPVGRAPVVDTARLDSAARALAEDVKAFRGSLVRLHGALAEARVRLEARLPAPRQAGRNVVWAFAYALLFSVSVAIYPVYFPRYLVELGLGPALVGAVVAASWVTYALAQPLGARLAERTGRDRAITVASIVAAGLLNVAMARSALVGVIVAWALIGVADGLSRPVAMALVASSVPKGGRGEAFGWAQSAVSVARIVAPFSFAFIITSRGIDDAILVTGVLMVLAALPVALIRKVEDEPATHPGAVPAGGAA